MPFLKFSRDKRGYENYYLFEGKGRPRLLFWFRTPPQVKVGRAPFSDDVRKMVEAQNPGMTFDWPRLMATPIPPRGSLPVSMAPIFSSTAWLQPMYDVITSS